MDDTGNDAPAAGRDDLVAALLAAAGRGDAAANDRLFGLLYDELRQCAHRQLRSLSSRTLSTTAPFRPPRRCRTCRSPTNRRPFLTGTTIP